MSVHWSWKSNNLLLGLVSVILGFSLKSEANLKEDPASPPPLQLPLISRKRSCLLINYKDNLSRRLNLPWYAWIYIDICICVWFFFPDLVCAYFIAHKFDFRTKLKMLLPGTVKHKLGVFRGESLNLYWFKGERWELLLQSALGCNVIIVFKILCYENLFLYGEAWYLVSNYLSFVLRHKICTLLYYRAHESDVRSRKD